MSPLWLLLGLLALTGSSESSSWGCYGNIRTLNTPGASCVIGRRHGLPYCGVRASERLAEIDRPYLLRYQPTMRIVGRKYCMDPAVIAGVLSRESQGGNFVVDMGNMGNGIGVIQDSSFYPPTSWKSDSWVSQKTEILTSKIKEVQARFPSWTPDQYLRGGLCAYSKGPTFVRSNQDLNCDFCNDVLARAKYFKNHGF
ncbi:lysozyme g-like protein 1 [Peromyscus maniculatus bairdii]|uniref:lysozyme g-like protein 1 n=1 Tax=Peromyscus maniculatus bairdii TaxID=230844 RepID=UPI00042ADAA7|nr:lysozyme g-like protein 1 [Peromyscus maniculatus bairdii]XP_052601066.1 lysozyme g-like protein 1 [Peromyscus californicus insignis]